MNQHMKFNIVESSLAAGVNPGSRSCSTCSVMVSRETADRKGDHLD
jgi:ferredoxin